MTETEKAFDWSKVQGHVTERLRTTRVVPVPEHIVKLAQKAYNGVPHPEDPERVIHSLEHEFPTPEIAAQFAKHMKNAGAHTEPLSSVTVVVDPDRKGDEPVNPRLVVWRAGKRRGKATA